MSREALVELDDVSMTFHRKVALTERAARFLTRAPAPPRAVHAVDRVSLTIAKGEVVGLVGESGCGKSTLGRIAAGIFRPTGGRLRWRGSDVSALAGADYRKAKLRNQMIFQDPMSSLNPRLRISEIVGEAPRIHGLVPAEAIPAYVDEQLRSAGLDPAYKRRFPHQFSGGQRQRIGIARALAVQPEFLVCDESVASLDVSIQAQVLNLFMRLRTELDLTYLFISHDLGVVQHLSDRVAIMYLGRVIEQAPTAEVFSKPNHPYTRSLLASIPRVDQRKKSFASIKGELPSPLRPPPGCHFHPRCPHAFDRCRVEVPRLKPVAADHLSACHLNDRAA